jgi:hypothetical protein
VSRPADSAQPPGTLWFFDTVTLLTTALEPGFAAAITTEVEATNGRRIVVDVVVDELKYRATQAQTARMARAALSGISNPGWTHLPTDRVSAAVVHGIQVEVNDGRPVGENSNEHWGESVMIAMFRRLATRERAPGIVFLSDDFDARRVAGLTPGVRPAHLAALLFSQRQRGVITDDEMLRLTGIAHAAGRGPDITADDLARGWRGLGRAGHPPF